MKRILPKGVVRMCGPVTQTTSTIILNLPPPSSTTTSTTTPPAPIILPFTSTAFTPPHNINHGSLVGPQDGLQLKTERETEKGKKTGKRKNARTVLSPSQNNSKKVNKNAARSSVVAILPKVPQAEVKSLFILTPTIPLEKITKNITPISSNISQAESLMNKVSSKKTAKNRLAVRKDASISKTEAPKARVCKRILMKKESYNEPGHMDKDNKNNKGSSVAEIEGYTAIGTLPSLSRAESRNIKIRCKSSNSECSTSPTYTSASSIVPFTATTRSSQHHHHHHHTVPHHPPPHHHHHTVPHHPPPPYPQHLHQSLHQNSITTDSDTQHRSTDSIDIGIHLHRTHEKDIMDTNFYHHKADGIDTNFQLTSIAPDSSPLKHESQTNENLRDLQFEDQREIDNRHTSGLMIGKKAVYASSPDEIAGEKHEAGTQLVYSVSSRDEIANARHESHTQLVYTPAYMDSFLSSNHSYSPPTTSSNMSLVKPTLIKYDLTKSPTTASPCLNQSTQPCPSSSGQGNVTRETVKAFPSLKRVADDPTSSILSPSNPSSQAETYGQECTFSLPPSLSSPHVADHSTPSSAAFSQTLSSIIDNHCLPLASEDSPLTQSNSYFSYASSFPETQMNDLGNSSSHQESGQGATKAYPCKTWSCLPPNDNTDEPTQQQKSIFAEMSSHESFSQNFHETFDSVLHESDLFPKLPHGARRDHISQSSLHSHSPLQSPCAQFTSTNALSPQASPSVQVANMETDQSSFYAAHTHQHTQSLNTTPSHLYTQSPQANSHIQSAHHQEYAQSSRESSHSQSTHLHSYAQSSRANVHSPSTHNPSYAQSSQANIHSPSTHNPSYPHSTQVNSHALSDHISSYAHSSQVISDCQSPHPPSYAHSARPSPFLHSPQASLSSPLQNSNMYSHPPQANIGVQASHLASYNQVHQQDSHSQFLNSPVSVLNQPSEHVGKSPAPINFLTSGASYCRSPAVDHSPHTTSLPPDHFPSHNFFKDNECPPSISSCSASQVMQTSHYIDSPEPYSSQNSESTHGLHYYSTVYGKSFTGEVESPVRSIGKSFSPPSYESHLKGSTSYIASVTGNNHANLTLNNEHNSTGNTHAHMIMNNEHDDTRNNQGNLMLNNEHISSGSYSPSCQNIKHELAAVQSKNIIGCPPAYPSPSTLLSHPPPPPKYNLPTSQQMPLNNSLAPDSSNYHLKNPSMPSISQPLNNSLAPESSNYQLNGAVRSGSLGNDNNNYQLKNSSPYISSAPHEMDNSNFNVNNMSHQYITNGPHETENSNFPVKNSLHQYLASTLSLAAQGNAKENSSYHLKNSSYQFFASTSSLAAQGDAKENSSYHLKNSSHQYFSAHSDASTGLHVGSKDYCDVGYGTPSPATFPHMDYLPSEDLNHGNSSINTSRYQHRRPVPMAQENNCPNVSWSGSGKEGGVDSGDFTKFHSLFGRAENVWFIPCQEQNRVYTKRKELARTLLNNPDMRSKEDLKVYAEFGIEVDEPIAEEILAPPPTSDGFEDETAGDEVDPSPTPAAATNTATNLINSAIIEPPKKSTKMMLCQMCGKLLKGKKCLQSHLNSHHNVRPFVCKYCSKPFTNRSVLVEHVRTHTGETPFACTHCPAAFRSRSGLLRHKHKHSEDRPFECSMCSKAFKTKLVLQQHMKLHLTGLFTCSDCGETFERHKSLAAHKVHHQNASQKFMCPHCPKGYRLQSLLNQHMQLHSEVRKHECSVCQQSFVWRSGLAAHMRTHSTDRPQCNVCGKRFASEKRLETHSQTHKTPQLHQCKICGKNFTHAYRLSSHMQIHQEHKEYPCNKCNLLFSSTKKLRNHLSDHTKEIQ